MASKVFLDANFLLDLTLQRDGFHHSSEIIQLAIDSRIRLFTTPAVLHIVAFYTTQAYNAKHSKQLLLTLLNDVKIIDCDHNTVLLALNSNIDDVEDAFLYYTALKSGMDYFISADKKLRKAAIPQLPVFTAAELLAEFKRSF